MTKLMQSSVGHQLGQLPSLIRVLAVLELYGFTFSSMIGKRHMHLNRRTSVLYFDFLLYRQLN